MYTEFEHRMLRRILGPKGCEDTGEWRKVHSEKLRNLYTASNIVRMIISGGLDGWGAGEVCVCMCVCVCVCVCKSFNWKL
jgi:hypothetical protein